MRSIVLSAFYPESKHNYSDFQDGILIMKDKGIKKIEFCYYGEDEEKVKKLLEDNEIESIYLAAIPLKEGKLSLSSLDEDQRKKAVEIAIDSLKKAEFYNSESLLINSGRKPENNDCEAAILQLKKSIIEITDYIKVYTKREIMINLETGDQEVDGFETLGSTVRARAFIEELRSIYKEIYLTLDTSHLSQLGEDTISSLVTSTKYCNHIHYANCIIKDKSSPLYGDKHPEFGVDKGEYTLEDIKVIHTAIQENYSKKITIGTEIIAREHDRKELIIETINNFNWLYI